MTRVVLASGNVGKLREMSALLAPLGFELLTLGSLGIPSPEETGTTDVLRAVGAKRGLQRYTHEAG